MEMIDVWLGDDAAFDEALRRGLPEGRDLTIITKDNATTAGTPAAVITFTVQLPDGTEATAQAVTTVRALHMAMTALEGRYGAFTGRLATARQDA